jgi:hypothetical protein
MVDKWVKIVRHLMEAVGFYQYRKIRSLLQSREHGSAASPANQLRPERAGPGGQAQKAHMYRRFNALSAGFRFLDSM